ncbi:MAG: tRNA-dihydrouridine synthase 3 [Peltula sp. TS41687]|nr:MAG: tRNA-dihydrouridine synthase 3 [Peltula sp. TS41687]
MAEPQVAAQSSLNGSLESDLDGLKRINAHPSNTIEASSPRKRLKSSDGVALIRAEYLVHPASAATESLPPQTTGDDEAEASQYIQKELQRPGKDKSRPKGQNTNRAFGYSRDTIELCSSRIYDPELSPRECRFGDRCKYEHDLRRYLAGGKAPDLDTFNGGRCPNWERRGVCANGFKCRFLRSHMEERTREDGTKELVLIEDPIKKDSVAEGGDVEFVNVIDAQQKIDLSKRKIRTEKADAYVKWLDLNTEKVRTPGNKHSERTVQENGEAIVAEHKDEIEDNRAQYIEPPLLPSEKRRLYFGPATPVLAPLTTQGNLPFRRLCVDLGAQMTYSEMAMSLPLIQGSKSEWALLRAHRSEITPPVVRTSSQVIEGYQNSKDMKFGVQIAASKPWQAIKATELLTTLCPRLRLVDLNCGCPIDMIYRAGAGSALLDNQAKLERIIQGMNAVSGEVPVTVKIRTGTKDGKPTALKLARRLVLGGQETNAASTGRSGVAAITLHGRSRQQRYTKSADWAYISECAALIKRINEEESQVTDTVREEDPRTAVSHGKVFFIGNGDCYSHVDYYQHLEDAGVDSVMLGRGALIKPWLFEEIQQNQYVDKSASERLTYVERFARYGLETWGSDEIGVGTTRRFLLEWLSFAHRYVPVGILERLPPRIQDRPPKWNGRNDLETLLGSENYKDWIKISEMFLGPTQKNFKFEPKHRSNANEAEAEG